MGTSVLQVKADVLQHKKELSSVSGLRLREFFRVPNDASKNDEL